MSDQTLPYDIEAERASLGSVLLQRDAIIAVDGWLLPEFFYLEKHAWIYEAMQAVYRRRVPPDVNTVGDELRRQDRLENIGGLAYLIELANAVPTAVHIEYYGHIVERTARARRLITVGGQIAALGFDERDEIDNALDKAEQLLFDVGRTSDQIAPMPLAQAIDETFERITAVANHRLEVTGLPTGYRDLDGLLGGLQPSDLIYLAARPRVGKTSFQLCLARNLAMAGKHVYIASLEMSRAQLVQRLLSAATGIDLHRLRTAQLRAAELEQLVQAMGQLSNLPITIDDMPGQSAAALRARAYRTHAQYPIDALMVDYVQLMAPTRRSRQSNLVEELSETSQGLKNLARGLDIPVIAASQLSRAVEGRATHVPLLSDLRGSGSLEQDADIVAFLHREELYDPETDKKGIAELIIAKHRNGPEGIIPLRWDGATTTFHNLEHYRAPAGY
jgi:replicative DNA helicase